MQIAIQIAGARSREPLKLSAVAKEGRHKIESLLQNSQQ
jgi:hypothetical protein